MIMVSRCDRPTWIKMLYLLEPFQETIVLIYLRLLTRSRLPTPSPANEHTVSWHHSTYIPLLSYQHMSIHLGFSGCQLYDLFLFYTFGSCKAIILRISYVLSLVLCHKY